MVVKFSGYVQLESTFNKVTSKPFELLTFSFLNKQINYYVVCRCFIEVRRFSKSCLYFNTNVKMARTIISNLRWGKKETNEV